MKAEQRRCLHQDTYYESDEDGNGQEHCRTCGLIRKGRSAKWQTAA